MPFVLLKLGGKERKFRLDYNTLSMVKAILGKDWPGMAAFFRRVSDDPDLVKALYLAAFKKDDPDLTLEQVGEMLNPGQMADLDKQIAEHFAYITQGAEAGNPPGGTTQTPETAKLTGPSPSEEPEKQA
jgi:hypothetical protein